MLKNLLRENLLTPVPDVVYRLRAKRPLKYKKRMTMKKLWFLCILLLACTGVLYAQELRSYYNDKTGWSGVVMIECMGEAEEDLWEEMIRPGALEGYIKDYSNLVPVTKLSQREKWLIQQALGEYDVADNEVYVIGIVDEITSSSFLMVIIRIKNNGRSFDIHALRGD